MAAPASVPPAERWAHLIPSAYESALALIGDEADNMHGFVDAFHRHIQRAMPLTPDEDDHIRLVGGLEWHAGRVIRDPAAASRDLYDDLKGGLNIPDTQRHLAAINLDSDLHPVLARQLRILHARHGPVVWRALRAHLVATRLRYDTQAANGWEDADDDSFDYDADSLHMFHAMMQDVDGDMQPLRTVASPSSSSSSAPAAASSSSGAKRPLDDAAAAAADPSIVRAALSRWDRHLDVARRAGVQSARAAAGDAWEKSIGTGSEAMPSFIRAFKAAIHTACPGADRVLVAVDAQVAWELHMFEQNGDIDSAYAHLIDAMRYSEPAAANTQRRQRNFPGTTRASILFRVRRIHQQSPDAWRALVHVAEAVKPAASDAAASPSHTWTARRLADYNTFQAYVQEAMQPDAARGDFDASQLERHMYMQHRVPADVANLIGQFATSSITAQAIVPLRLQVRHRLELLARRVASLTPAQAAEEMRAILSVVQRAAPDNAEPQATKKKARSE